MTMRRAIALLALAGALAACGHWGPPVRSGEREDTAKPATIDPSAPRNDREREHYEP